MGQLRIARLPPAAADDLMLTSAVAALINEVYAVAEEGLWVDGTSRTTAEEIAGLIRARQVAVACAGGRFVGCVCIQQLDSSISEFGMLAVVPSHRGIGVGRELVRFAEQVSRRERRDTMQLEVLVPRGWSHPSKEFITGWYHRIGYKPTRTATIEESYPDLAPFLATPCDLVVYRKGPHRRREPGGAQ
jgi:GNAT superfamily N-acetyltransferase